MSFKLNLFAILMLVVHQSVCKKITLTTKSKSHEVIFQDINQDVASISYGDKDLKSREKIEVTLRYPRYLCINNDHLVVIKTYLYMPKDTKFIIKKSFDFLSYSNFSPSTINPYSIEADKVCLFIGHQEYNDSTGVKAHIVYINMLSDLKVVDQQDVLFLYLENLKTSFKVELSQNKNVVGDEGNPRYEKKKLLLKTCDDKSYSESISFDLTGRTFWVQPGAIFSMAFVNTQDIKIKPTINPSEAPKFDCLNSSVKFTYSGQINDEDILIV